MTGLRATVHLDESVFPFFLFPLVQKYPLLLFLGQKYEC